MKDTILRNPDQLGRVVRVERLARGLSQNALAAQIGVERKWVIRLEAGNAGAELGLVLKVFTALGLRASLGGADRPLHGDRAQPTPSRLDEVFRRLQRSERD